MSWPYFPLATSLRVAPIDLRMREVSISTEATIELNILRERCLAVAHVQACAIILLAAGRWPNIAKVMKSIGAIDIDPADVSPEHWRHSHSRLAAREAPRSYTRQRHDAWLMRRRTWP
ncbi:DUF2840 domain-containing protein [Mesorhizobium tianshanense]|uniref:Uncharacterized protein DUF2840 n=1 Tax=Mesorhizobium tianshanense TaxID=39844 RepID=A0A562NRE3_9HYPH|nr:DUF2840 domain-containing protein [Mesorhizobium tianshanense]TWI34758.1 uncharacterized protein DUF2840 [Mesorhizobium tianshanense]